MDNSGNHRAEFTFGWLALKLLGKSLYSNYWSAISELVANGFDAQASNVYVYLDISDKQHTYMEIFDDGNGMTPSDIMTYVKVGYNKRTDANSSKGGHPELIMGRKGIGKLAALFLSSNYRILTKTEEGIETRWEMNFKENPQVSDEHPYLLSTEKVFTVACSHEWNSFKKGTMLQLHNINLIGMGEKAFESLKLKLSNSFSLESMDNRQILFFKKDYLGQEIKFEPVEKAIAFGNMAYIETSFYNVDRLKDKLKSYDGKELNIPFQKIDGSYKHLIKVSEFPNTAIDDEDNNNFQGFLQKGKYKGKEYILNGWIGIHSTINTRYAENNDQNFSRNRFYNPAEVRLYVRNKLAMENFLNVVKNTQAFVNYIEGEINFDILDDDEFEDIATSNRQGLDERDGRVELLIKIVSTIILDLIRKRLSLSDKIKEIEKTDIDTRQKVSKQVFSDEVAVELKNVETLSQSQRAELNQSITNKIKGDITPKNKHIVFLSHTRRDKLFSDFFYYLLLKVGVKKEEFFYTSSENNPERIVDLSILGDQILKNIKNDNALILFVTSQHYRENEFCLFEGGAGWATRSVGAYIIVADEFSHIPPYLTNGKSELTLKQGTGITLDQDIYGKLIIIFNRIIEHINNGRKMDRDVLVSTFPNPEFYDQVSLKKMNKRAEDFMDENIKEYWKTYIEQKMPQYEEDKKPSKG